MFATLAIATGTFRNPSSHLGKGNLLTILFDLYNVETSVAVTKEVVLSQTQPLSCHCECDTIYKSKSKYIKFTLDVGRRPTNVGTLYIRYKKLN